MYTTYRLTKEQDVWYFHKDKIFVNLDDAKNYILEMNTHPEYDARLLTFTHMYLEHKIYFLDPLPLFEIKKRGLANRIYVEN